MADRLHSTRRGILAVFQEMDDATARFAAATGLRCPDGCGACCQNPAVSATPAEMTPLALDLLARGEAEHALERARAAENAWCIFHHHHGGDAGRCSIYAVRPGVCRLFGFAGTRDKRGDPELAACWRLGEYRRDVMERAQDDVAAGRVPMPVFADWRRRLDQVDPSLSGPPVQINRALRLALERVLTHAAYASGG
ncbi:MAG: YkgJ family cysteine cluster protein [Deltaproteobacteria bacterium]|nr:YkgJ family cysteine cluster protein [Deltaproteobacteria bacterium]